MPRALALLGSLFASLLLVAAARAQDPVKLELLSDVSAIEPGASFKVAVRAEIDEGWHIYWNNPGESGLPTLVTWTLPEGFEAGPLNYPVPHRYVQEFSDDFKMVSHTKIRSQAGIQREMLWTLNDSIAKLCKCIVSTRHH